MKLVLDASVVVKWLLSETGNEPDADRAVALLEDVRRGRVSLLQPPHWLAEASAVVTRLQPEVADQMIQLLDAMHLPVAGDIAVYRRASRISRELNHHLFDTLYHAVALEHAATLISADEHYSRKAAHLGRLVPLADWPEGLPRDSD